MIYLDYAASTPTDKQVLDLFYETTLKYYANPNSNHKLGSLAKELIDKSTSHIANYLGVLPEEIIYTSGSSESNNLAIVGVCRRYKNRGKHIIISSLEHTSITSPVTVMQEEGFEVDVIPLTKEGIIDIEELKKLIRDDTILISITSLDSELGIRQPIEMIGSFLKQNYPNIIFHTDASQIIGKSTIDFKNVDLVTIAPHKFYGMNGFGALIKKKGITLKPIINGGKSTTVYRSGTPITASIVALDKALEIAFDNQENRLEYVTKLNKKIVDTLITYKNVHINSTDLSIPYIINFSLKGVQANTFVKLLEDNDVYASTKTSCCPIGTPSKLVYALTRDKSLSSSSIRVSLSHLTTKSEVEEFLRIFDKCYKEVNDNGKI